MAVKVRDIGGLLDFGTMMEDEDEEEDDKEDDDDDEKEWGGSAEMSAITNLGSFLDVVRKHRSRLIAVLVDADSNATTYTGRLVSAWYLGLQGMG